MAPRLADKLGVARPLTFSQRDETGLSRAMLPLLNKHGVRYISLGSGGSPGRSQPVAASQNCFPAP